MKEREAPNLHDCALRHFDRCRQNRQHIRQTIDVATGIACIFRRCSDYKIINPDN
jgi:hypothetical protein